MHYKNSDSNSFIILNIVRSVLAWQGPLQLPLLGCPFVNELCIEVTQKQVDKKKEKQGTSSLADSLSEKKPSTPVSRHQFTKKLTEVREASIKTSNSSIVFVWEVSLQRQRPLGIDIVIVVVGIDPSCFIFVVFVVDSDISFSQLNCGGVEYIGVFIIAMTLDVVEILVVDIRRRKGR